jgi:phenylalanyl-tRNA synthetase beta chain
MKEYLTFAISPQEMIDRLTAIGHEVEEIIDLGLLNNPIRIARILSVEPHPDAGNLTVCQVDDGTDEPATVVCGAPNAAEGVVSVLARAGARLPSGQVLKRAKLRGVASEGMLLALDEMGLGSDHAGIVILEPDAPVGEGYDVILEVKITPNRPDCLSVFGLARDLAAAYGRKVYAKPSRLRETYENAHDLLRVSIKCPDHCPRYTARVMRRVHVGPSPDWIQRRLLAVGLRPINNVVDATNLVLVELGHPMHAFDYDKVRRQEIIVRMAAPGEKIRLLDETELDLAPGKDMVIADGEAPIALAGIMGGAESEVGDATESVLLESAYFKPATIRRSARRHRLSTDASYRFERGADPEALTVALDRAAAWIAEIAGGEVPKGIVDAKLKPHAPVTLMLRPARACRILGIDASKTEIADLLAALEFEILRSETDILVVSVPSYRCDVAREEDLYEEIARLYGYDRIPATMPYLPAGANRPNERVRLRRLIQDCLTGLGLSEAITLSFTGAPWLDQLELPHGDALRIRNPLSRDQALLRTELASSLIHTLLHNQNRGNSDLHLFEIGKGFRFGDMAAPCVEEEALAIGVMGASRAASWRAGRQSRPVDFFDLKGVLETLFAELGVADVEWVPGGPPLLHPGRSARVRAGDAELGWAGELHPRLRDRLEFRERPQLAEIQIEPLRPLASRRRLFRELPRYPAIERDFAVIVDRDVPAERVGATVRDAAGELLESLFLFDSYEGEQAGPGKKSLGYRVVLRHAERTLTDEEAEEVQSKVLARLAQELGATLRA